VLLGPSTDQGPLERVLAEEAPSGPVGLIRAGWQEWESEPSRLSRHLADRAVNLGLHERAERIWAEDPELTEAHHSMQRDVRTLRNTYNLRLAHLMDAWLELIEHDGPNHLLEPERDAALQAIRDLDEHQRARVAQIRAGFAAEVHLEDRHAVARERAEIGELLDDVTTVIVDGGHVAVILNRMRLLGLVELLTDRTVVGISGGAMVLAERLVLFHDSPPWGPGHAEVAESGLGLAPDIVCLPHAKHRLRLDDAGRMERLARRFAPAECVLLEDKACLAWSGEGWAVDTARHLTPSGGVAAWGATA